jgi:hypothetical protein
MTRFVSIDGLVTSAPGVSLSPAAGELFPVALGVWKSTLVEELETIVIDAWLVMRDESMRPSLRLAAGEGLQYITRTAASNATITGVFDAFIDGTFKIRIHLATCPE